MPLVRFPLDERLIGVNVDRDWCHFELLLFLLPSLALERIDKYGYDQDKCYSSHCGLWMGLCRW